MCPYPHTTWHTCVTISSWDFAWQRDIGHHGSLEMRQPKIPCRVLRRLWTYGKRPSWAKASFPWPWLLAKMMAAPPLKPCLVKVLCTKKKEKKAVLDSKMWSTIIYKEVLISFSVSWDSTTRCWNWMIIWMNLFVDEWMSKLNPTISTVCDRNGIWPSWLEASLPCHGYGYAY
jgi:hypothetical protein